jgi:hypothetical protein
MELEPKDNKSHILNKSCISSIEDDISTNPLDESIVTNNEFEEIKTKNLCGRILVKLSIIKLKISYYHLSEQNIYSSPSMLFLSIIFLGLMVFILKL